MKRYDHMHMTIASPVHLYDLASLGFRSLSTPILHIHGTMHQHLIAIIIDNVLACLLAGSGT